MLTKDCQVNPGANVLAIYVGSRYLRSYTVHIVEKFVKRAKANSEPQRKGTIQTLLYSQNHRDMYYGVADLAHVKEKKFREGIKPSTI